MSDFINSAKEIFAELPHLLLHSFKDTIHILPFLFISYLVMEFIEHKASDKLATAIRRSGKAGPFIGSAVGIIPQCGFSTLASSFYAGKIITMGTIVAVFLSTSDEMLPVMISNKFPVASILIILFTKFIIAVIAGFIIDLIFRPSLHNDEEIEEFCNHEHCQCEKGIFRSSLYHTVHVFIFILIVTIVLNIFIHFVGEDKLASLVIGKPVLGQLIAGIIGLIPNCASSVIITELYIKGAISAGAMMSGLLVGAGVGLLVLFRTNKHLKENLIIAGLMYSIGVIFGILLDLINFGAILK